MLFTKEMNKKGQWQLLAPIISPWVLLGIAIFIIVFAAGLYFAVAKIVALIIVLGALYLMANGFNPWIGFAMLLIGLLIIWNPFEALLFEMKTLQLFMGG